MTNEKLRQDRASKFQVTFRTAIAQQHETWIKRIPAVGEEVLFNVGDCNIRGYVDKIKTCYVEPFDEDTDHFEYHIIWLR